MPSRDKESRTADDDNARVRPKDGREADPSTSPRRPDAEVTVGAPGAEPRSDSPETMQTDPAAVPGRQRYADARPGDYSPDFQEDGSGSHPVKPSDEARVDEDGIPRIASRKPGSAAQGHDRETDEDKHENG